MIDKQQKPGLILIVDDVASNLKVLFTYLTNDGFEVLVAQDGESALEKAEYALPDLILLDIVMPRMDGFEVCRQLKAKASTQDIPIIFMSALHEVTNKVKGFQLGAIDYLTKPIDREEVLVRIKTHITLQKMRQSLAKQNQQLRKEIYRRKQIESELNNSKKLIQRANAELEQRVIERTQTLADFSTRLKQIHRLATTNYEQLEDLFDDYIKTGCQIFNLSTGIVSQVSDHTYTILAVRSPLNLAVGFEANYKDTYCAEVIEKQTTLSFYHVGARENMKEHPVYQNLRLESFISTLIFVNGKIFGTLNFADTIPRERKFQSYEREIIELMARNMGHSLATWQSKAALEESRTELQQANQAKDNFIAHMNHELRTPLNGILGFTQILQKDPHLTSQQNQNLNLIHQSGRHLLDLINDILNFSKIEANKIQLEEQDFDLRNFLDNLVATSCLRATQKNIDFYARCSSSLPQVVQADETRLRQVLLNLLSNAIKFTERGQVTFQVSYVGDFEPEAEENEEGRETISQSSIQNHQIRFQIKDTGIGIPENKLEDIFLPFEQVHEMPSQGKGTGLGLTISQKLIQLMGSKIQVISTVGEGSIFWFDLDLLEGNPANVSTTNVQYEIQPTGFSGQPRKVLIVDDLTDNRQLLIQYLQPLGFKLAEAENGQQGLAISATFRPDVILLDMLMPEMDGLEMLKQLRQHPQLKETKVIFVSANSHFAEQLQTSQLQFEDFLSKPVDFDQLLQSLQTHLRLQWLFPESAKESDSVSLVAPPQKTLSKLWDLAKMGDMGELEEQINSLEQLDAQYLPFLHKVRKLVESFNQNQLIKFLEHIRDSP